jgi:uncharacterized membrane protein
LFLRRLLAAPQWTVSRVKAYLGFLDGSFVASRWTRVGLGVSGGFLILAGLLLLAVEPLIIGSLAIAGLLIGFGIFNLVSTLGKKLTVFRANQLSLLGHLTAVVALYLIVSRILIVSYATDTLVATYMGVLRTMQFQSPYAFSIKPLLDQFGFSPSFYTPGVDGSFDFHLAYPSLSFLSVLPFYEMGLQDLRDTVFIFFILSILVIFGLSPAKFKSISLAPFGLFPAVIAGGWTDSIWAFFLVLTALLWYRYPKASWVSLGLAVAVKQIAIVIAPFLLIRLWHENPTSRTRSLVTNAGLMLAAFFLPNLPFIIASPGSWWASIVVPYLPNSPAQVPGGIGLSSVLLDLGIALPSGFYLVLVLGASSFLLFEYARHYRSLNSMVYAFPIFIFFLYYRSFPNYMAYWVFPLVLEVARLGGPNLKLLRSSIKLPTITWRPPPVSFLKVVRRRLTPSVMVLMALAMAFVGVSGAYISEAATQKTTIQINGVMDPDSIGAVTTINVTLRNLETTPVLPSFFVKWSFLPYIWISNSASLLQSGAQESYLINAPDALSAVPRGDQFHVMIYDKLTGQLLGESTASKANVPTPQVANPALKWWTLDESVGKKVPFDWKLSAINTDLVSSRISPLGANGTSGLQMMLNYTTTGIGLEELALSQKLLLNETDVSLQFSQPLASVNAGSLMATSITDGTHTLYFVYSNRTTQETTITYASNTTVIVPVKASTWNTLTINPSVVWNSQGWNAPLQVTLSFLLGSETPGVYYASVSYVNPS